MTRRQVLLIVAIFIATRIALTAIGTLTVVYLPATEGDEFKHLRDGGPALDMWYRWDAGFYATIATDGYKWQNEGRPSDDMVFLPLYPYAVRAVMALSGCGFSPYLSTCATVSGLIVSNVALLAASFLLFDLTRRYTDTDTAWRALWLLMLSPGSIFLSGVYTEALFLFLCLLTFWLLDRERFLLAVLAAGLACLTRAVGVALVPAILWVAWHQRPQWRLYRAMYGLFPVWAFGAYVLITGLTVGNPLAYFQSYSTTWGRVSGSPIDAFTVYFSGVPVSLYGWNPAWIDLIATVGYLALAVVVLRRKVEWGLFALGALIIPIMTGTLLSMPRFGTVIFPFYIVLAQWANTRPKQALVYGVFVALMMFVAVWFARYRWIA
jgi:hypothetical protein